MKRATARLSKNAMRGLKSVLDYPDFSSGLQGGNKYITIPKLIYLKNKMIDEKRRVFRLLYDLYSFFTLE